MAEMEDAQLHIHWRLCQVEALLQEFNRQIQITARRANSYELHCNQGNAIINGDGRIAELLRNLEDAVGNPSHLVFKGMKSSESFDRTLDILHVLSGLPNNRLIGDGTRQLYTALANLPHFLQRFEQDFSDPKPIARASLLARVAESERCPRLAPSLFGFANQQYKTAGVFLDHIITEIKLYYFPQLDFQCLIFLMGLLTNTTDWFRISRPQTTPRRMSGAGRHMTRSPLFPWADSTENTIIFTPSAFRIVTAEMTTLADKEFQLQMHVRRMETTVVSTLTTIEDHTHLASTIRGWTRRTRMMMALRLYAMSTRR
ncbi:unnamed protein product [Penicillium bialowiezense]